MRKADLKTDGTVYAWHATNGTPTLDSPANVPVTIVAFQTNNLVVNMVDATKNPIRTATTREIIGTWADAEPAIAARKAREDAVKAERAAAHARHSAARAALADLGYDSVPRYGSTAVELTVETAERLVAALQATRAQA